MNQERDTSQKCTRRELLKRAGITAAAILAGCAGPKQQTPPPTELLVEPTLSPLEKVARDQAKDFRVPEGDPFYEAAVLLRKGVMAAGFIFEEERGKGFSEPIGNSFLISPDNETVYACMPLSPFCPAVEEGQRRVPYKWFTDSSSYQLNGDKSLHFVFIRPGLDEEAVTISSRNADFEPPLFYTPEDPKNFGFWNVALFKVKNLPSRLTNRVFSLAPENYLQVGTNLLAAAYPHSILGFDESKQPIYGNLAWQEIMGYVIGIDVEKGLTLDFPVGSGFSGGALANEKGEMAGLVVATDKLLPISYAVPNASLWALIKKNAEIA